MKYWLLLFLFSLAAAGCGGYDDPRPDPTTDPDYVDTSDPNVVLGQQAQEREEKAEEKGKK